MGTPRPQPTARHATKSLLLFLIPFLLTAAACTTARPAPIAAPSPPTTPSTLPSVTATAPELDAVLGEELAGRRAGTSGNASVDYAGGEHGKALIVAVSCAGTGTIEVTLPVAEASFPLRCGHTEPATTYNQFTTPTTHRPGTVSVTAPKTVTWAVTIGRGEPTPPEPPSP
ncbi:hypothetical protein AB0D49_36970 [Streptomyces sp. NPDC048290]|uniref:hypothetical protein n=1 Tax=Streptomyces sp. NPDC048290 TaxID=3155811 RepID=UPI003439C352